MPGAKSTACRGSQPNHFNEQPVRITRSKKIYCFSDGVGNVRSPNIPSTPTNRPAEAHSVAAG